MAIRFIEPGSAATGDMTLFNTVNNATSSTTAPHTGSRCVDLGASSAFTVTPTTWTANGAGRVSLYIKIASTPVGDSTSFPDLRLVGASRFGAYIQATTGLIGIISGANKKVGSVAMPVNTWFRLAISYSITNTTTFTIKVWVDGTLSATATGADFTLGGATADRVVGTNIGIQTYLNDIYIDDGSGVDDPGDIRVTSLRPVAAGAANNFSDTVGSTTNRWDYVDKLPVATSLGLVQAGNASSISENFTLAGISAGDAPIPRGSTIIGYTPWVSAGRGGLNSDYFVTTNSATKQATTALGAVTTQVKDIVVVAFADQILGTTPTIADNFTNTWTALTTSTSTVRLSWWWAQIASGKSGSMTVTITHDNSSSSRGLALMGFSNCVPTGTPRDLNPANTTDGTSQYDGPLTGTMTQANELLVGVFAFAGPVGDTIAAVSPDVLSSFQGQKDGTTGGSAGANSTIVILTRRVAATTSVRMSATNATANRAGVQGIVSFKAGGDGTSVGTPKITSNGDGGTAVTLNQITNTSGAITPTTHQLTPTTSATFPSNAAGVGMISSAKGVPTYLYDCGTVIAYYPVQPEPPVFPNFTGQALNRSRTY